MPALDIQSSGDIVVRGFLFTTLLLVIGTGAFQQITLRMVRRRGTRAGLAVAPAADRRATSIAFAAAVALLVAVAGRLVVQQATVTTDLTTTVAATRWGHAWLLQLGATLVALAFLWSMHRTNRGRRGALAAMLVLAVTPMLSGHAMKTDPLVPLTVVSGTVHVLGASGWLGSLAVLLLAGVPAARQLEDADRHVAVAELVHAFSPVALICAGLVILSGSIVTLVHVRSAAALWSTAYGQLLLLKLGIFTLVTAAGAYNWRLVRPALGGEVATTRLQRYATLELAVALAVVAITALLVATPLPRELGIVLHG